MSDPYDRPTLASSVHYEDPMRAFDWLQQAFGFEPSMLITDADGKLAHSELRLGNGMIFVGDRWADFVGTPTTTGGKNTQMVHVHLDEDIDAHCERARAAGAEIQQAPADQFYGDRTYRAKDFEGHVWTFSQTKRRLQPEEWDAASGLKTKMFR
ncbi:MAG TPA: VOC family protein [Reyranella sp.]|nr:VOC family protein [Reyranella sp.]